MKHLIIGVSAAGIAAAKTIRALRPDDEIVMAAKDKEVHSRCMLHHFIGGAKSAEEINFAGADFFEKNNIKFLADEEITAVTPQKNCALGARSGEITYDTLLITTGARYFIPPIQGFREAKNVFGLRDLSDARRIDDAAKGAAECVIVGSGLVGLDAAYALCERGVKCRIVEMEDRISPLQLDKTAAAPYQKFFEEAGCEFYLSKRACGMEMDDAGNATHVLLESGERLPCAFVVVTAGVRPNVEFLDGSGITVDRCVKVDDYMRTNVENIWAAGDVAGLSGIWPNAALQGETAAKNICCGCVKYTDRYAMKNTMNFFGLTTLSLGPNSAEPGDEVIINECRTSYMKAIVRDGRVIHLTIQGDISNTGFWQELVKRGVKVRKEARALSRLSYADFWNCDEKSGEYLWAK
ncbi:MAG: FAD-dependent oxidoreductase [Cloacibacillus sp.]